MRNYERKTNRKKRGKHRGSLELRGKVYVARWMVNGKRFSETTGETSRAAAEKWLARKLANVQALDIRAKGQRNIETILQQKAAQFKGAIVQAREEQEAALDDLPSLPLAALAGEVTQAVLARGVTQSTIANYSNEINKFVGWMRETHPEADDISHVTEEMAREYFDRLGAVNSANTCNGAKAVLMYAWRIASKRYRVKHNPFTAIEKKKRIPPARRELTPEELSRIASVLPGDYRITFFVGCFTGLRLSDAASITWDEIDLANGFISLMPKKTARTSGRRVDLPIMPELYAVLSTIPPERRNGYVTPETARMYRTARSALSKRFTAYFREAGIETQVDAGDGRAARNVCGFHSLRHTFISLAGNAGIPFLIVKSIVGHTDEKMTRHYFHENRDATRAAFEKFPRLFSREPAARITDVIDVEAVAVEPARRSPRLAALEAALDDVFGHGDDAEIEAARRMISARTEKTA